MIYDDNGLEAYVERKMIAEFLRHCATNGWTIEETINAVSTGEYRKLAGSALWVKSEKTP